MPDPELAKRGSQGHEGTKRGCDAAHARRARASSVARAWKPRDEARRRGRGDAWSRDIPGASRDCVLAHCFQEQKLSQKHAYSPSLFSLREIPIPRAHSFSPFHKSS